MSGGGEAGAVADGDQQRGGGPDRDPRNRGQDRGKRVSLQQLSDLRFQGPSLLVNGGERTGQGRDHEVEGGGARDHDGLLVERIEDLVGQPLGHARSLGPDHLGQLAASGIAQGGRGSVAFQQPGHGGVVQARTQHASRLGWNWVSRPRIRLEVRVASAARSWSKPTSTVSSAVIPSVS